MALGNVEGAEFGEAADVDAFMPFAFVAAMGGVDLENISVSGFQLFQYAGFVYHSGTTVIGECSEKDSIFAIVFIKRYELGEVFAEQCVCLCLGELNTTSVWFTRLDLMPVAYVRPVLGMVHCLQFLDDEDCTLKERQFHNVVLSGESRRSDRYGHYRQNNHKYFLHRLSDLINQSGSDGSDDCSDFATTVCAAVVIITVLAVELKGLFPRS